MLGRTKQIAKHTYFEFLRRAGVTAWARRQLEYRGGSIVLTFHRVLEDDAFEKSHSPAGMIIRRRTFVDLITTLAREVDFVSVCDLPRNQSGRFRHLPVAITFDDGWSDNLRTCLDVLTPRGIPACIFICSSLVGRTLPFWPEQALSALRAARSVRPVPQELMEVFAGYSLDLLNIGENDLLQFLKMNPDARSDLLAVLGRLFPPTADMADSTMTWDELDELIRHGIELGSHTAHHEILTSLTPAQQVEELLVCDRRMEEELNVSPSFFSYPNGSSNKEAKQSVASHGYRYAFINATGVWSQDTDPHLVPRINLSENRLIGLGGCFSVASAQYYLFWLPYLNRKRSRLTSALRHNRIATFLRSCRISVPPSYLKRRRG